MNYPELLIIRHGETRWNFEGRMQGALNSDLTEHGQEQARGLNTLLRRASLTPAHSAWCSPQGRAQQTAKLALDGHFADWRTDARLAEVSVGAYEGLLFEDVMAEHTQNHPEDGPFDWQFHAPGGESWDEFHGRIESWLAALSGPAVVVTHGITSRVMRMIALGLSREAVADLPGGQGIIHRIRDGQADILAP